MQRLPDDHQYIGWYSPSEAMKLMTAMDTAGISFLAEFKDGIYKQHSALVLIAVESARKRDVEVIHAEVLRSALPSDITPFESFGEEVDPKGTDEFALRERRQALIDERLELDDKLEAIMQEIAAVDRELQFPKQSSARLDALRRNRENQKQAGAELINRKARINDEIRGINDALG